MPLTLRRLEWRRSESNRHLPRCKRGARPVELHPQVKRSMRTGGVEPPQREATGLQPAELAACSASAYAGWPAGLEPAPTGLTTPGASVYTTATTSGDDRTRTGGLSPDKRALCSSELRPRNSAGGIRTHGLELMRLARTASPLPRRSGWQESNLRSPAPEAGGVANSPTARRSCEAPPAGLEPAASGLRARRHRRFDHGGTARACNRLLQAGRLRRQGSNLPLAINSRASYRLDHAGTTRQVTDCTCSEAETAGLEPANGSCRLRASNALPCQLGHVSRSGRRGSRTPKARGPPVFETGYRAGGSPSESGPGRRRTCTVPGKSRELCRVELRSRDVTGRDRTCDAPRFRRALYRAELRSRAMGGAGVEPAASSVIREALCHLSYPPSCARDGRGWDRTSSLLCVRQALFRVELLARAVEIRGKGSNLDLHVQSVVSCRLDDPGTNGCNASPSISRTGDRRSRRAPAAGD